VHHQLEAHGTRHEQRDQLPKRDRREAQREGAQQQRSHQGCEPASYYSSEQLENS
jgi:hypothetical protein